MDCKDCGHCIDLHEPSDKDPEVVVEARKKIIEIFKQW
jgi:hypothetical protein